MFNTETNIVNNDKMSKTKLLLKRLMLPGAIALTVFMFSQSFGPSPKKGKYHSNDEMTRLMVGTLPIGENSVFIGSGKCAGCHGNDPLDYANMTSEGEDVNMTDSWRATMMANSAISVPVVTLRKGNTLLYMMEILIILLQRWSKIRSHWMVLLVARAINSDRILWGLHFQES
jgi:hypothetical protein